MRPGQIQGHKQKGKACQGVVAVVVGEGVVEGVVGVEEEGEGEEGATESQCQEDDSNFIPSILFYCTGT